MNNNKNYFLLVFYLILLFSDLLSILTPYFNYIDELLTILSIFFIIITFIKKGLCKKYIILLFLSFILVIIGILGNYVFKFQTNMYIILIDIIATFKLFIIYICFDYYLEGKSINEWILNKIFAIYKIFILVLFIFCLLNQFTNINMSVEYRYGIKGFSFIYGVPGIIINQCTYFLVMLLAKMKEIKKYSFILLSTITVLLILSTLKSRGFVLIGIYFLLLLMHKKNTKLLRTILILSAVIISCVIGYSQFDAYFISNQSSVRYLFLSNSFSLANKYFPLGTGFSTYGSGAAATFYSDVYYMIGFDTRFGLSPDNKLFLNDTFFPSILGQFGYFGFLIYLSILVFFVVILYKKFKRNNFQIVIFIIFDMLFSSIQSAYIRSSSMITLLLLGMIFMKKGDKKSGDLLWL